MKDIEPPLEAPRDPLNACPEDAATSVGLNVMPVALRDRLNELPAVTVRAAWSVVGIDAMYVTPP